MYVASFQQNKEKKSEKKEYSEMTQNNRRT